MTGKKGRSGRHKEPVTLLKEALAKLEGDMPAILDALKTAALGKSVMCQHCGKETAAKMPDVDACRYLVDRIMGKPMQQSELTVRGGLELTPGEIRDYMDEIEEAKTKFLGQFEAKEDDVSTHGVEADDNR